MALQPNDLVVVSRGGTTYQTTVNNLLEGAGGGVTVSETALDDPIEGQLWWADSDVNEGGGRLYVWTGDEWVDISLPGGGSGGGGGGGFTEPVTFTQPTTHQQGVITPGLTISNGGTTAEPGIFIDSEFIGIHSSNENFGGFIRLSNDQTDDPGDPTEILLSCDGTASFSGDVTFGTFDDGSRITTAAGSSVSKMLEFRRTDGGGDTIKAFEIVRAGTSEASITYGGNYVGTKFNGVEITDNRKFKTGNVNAAAAFISTSGEYHFRNSADSANSGQIRAGNVTTFLTPEEQTTYGIQDQELNLKERVLNLISRLNAIESNEIIDDATDTSLLQLLANASARLDSIEARLTALEGN